MRYVAYVYKHAITDPREGLKTRAWEMVVCNDFRHMMDLLWFGCSELDYRAALRRIRRDDYVLINMEDAFGMQGAKGVMIIDQNGIKKVVQK